MTRVCSECVSSPVVIIDAFSEFSVSRCETCSRILMAEKATGLSKATVPLTTDSVSKSSAGAPLVHVIVRDAEGLKEVSSNLPESLKPVARIVDGSGSAIASIDADLMADNPLRVCIIDAAIGDDAMTGLFSEIRGLEAKYDKPLSPFLVVGEQKDPELAKRLESWAPARFVRIGRPKTSAERSARIVKVVEKVSG